MPVDPSPTSVSHMPAEDFRRHGKALVDFIADYWARLGRCDDSLPVASRVSPGDLLAALPAHAPERGEAWETIFADVPRLILPGLTHWQSPSFFAYFPSNVSAPAVLGELLSAGLGVNGMLWATSPAATELETRVLDWTAHLLDLPPAFLSTAPGNEGGGVIQGTASDSALVAVVAARADALRRTPGADPAKLVAYTSTQAHSSIVKAAMVAGIARDADDRDHVRLIETGEHLAMRPDALAAAMAADAAAGRVPFFVCATVGTTSSLAVDDLRAIGPIAAKHNAWLHVDAAMAGAACVCPEHRWLLAGVGHADTFCFNPHKWLLTNFDCNVLFTRRRSAITSSLSITPVYLRNAASAAGSVIDYRDWQVPLGRRFRALKLWFVLRHYGLEGLRAHIREHVRLAALLEGWMRGDDRFEVLSRSAGLALLCFRLRGGSPTDDAPSRALVDRLNAGGRMLLTPTMLPPSPGAAPRLVLRLAIGSTMTQERHVRAAWEEIREEATRVHASSRDPLSSPAPSRPR